MGPVQNRRFFITNILKNFRLKIKISHFILLYQNPGMMITGKDLGDLFQMYYIGNI